MDQTLITATIIVLGLGTHWGMYQSFKKAVESKLAEHDTRISHTEGIVTGLKSDISVVQESVRAMDANTKHSIDRVEHAIRDQNKLMMEYLFNRGK